MHLRALGAEPVLIPAIETVAPSTFAPLDRALADLERFHWLLFTSANAVEAFARRLQHLGIAIPSAAPFPQIAAIGPATGRALEAMGLAPDLTPPQAIAESLAESLLPLVRQPDGTAARFLLIRAEEAREHLPDTLRAVGAEVVIAPAYKTVIPEASVALVRELFAKETAERIEAITFTSSSTARNLVALCEAAGITLPSSALRISIGPITSQTLRELLLPPHAEAAEATVSALAQSVLQALAAPDRCLRGAEQNG